MGVLGVTKNWDDTQTVRYKYHLVPKTWYDRVYGEEPYEVRGEFTTPLDVDLGAMFKFRFTPGQVRLDANLL